MLPMSRAMAAIWQYSPMTIDANASAVIPMGRCIMSLTSDRLLDPSSADHAVARLAAARRRSPAVTTRQRGRGLGSLPVGQTSCHRGSSVHPDVARRETRPGDPRGLGGPYS